MLLQIQGHHLPGRVWQTRDEHHDNIHVGIQVGKEPRELVRGDAETTSWAIPIEVVAREGALDFRGAAVRASLAPDLSTSRGVTSTRSDPSRCSAGPNSCSPTSHRLSQDPATRG